jgi:glutathione S-transferase
MLTIWGRANSVNVMKVLWLVEELGLPYRRIDAGGAFGRTQDADYVAMNPNPTVPTLVMPNGYSLWESNSILRFLARTQPGGERLYPQDAEGAGNVDRWMDWTLASLNGPLRDIFWTFIRIPEAERDLKAAAKARDAAERLFRILEAQLQGRDFIAGPLSIADMAMGGFVHRWFNLPIERPDLPNLRRWYEAMLARPAYAKNVAVLPLT